MRLGIFEQQEIERFFFLDYDIKQKERQIRETSEAFYDQSMATRTTYSDTELICVGFNHERNVIPYVDVIATIENSMEKLSKKQRYLNDYLDSLNPEESSYLINRYRHGVESRICQIDIDVYEEIKEINEAINFIYGYPQEIRKDDVVQGDSTQNNVNRMAELLGV